MKHCTVFKILLLVFKSLNSLAPTYISDLLTQYIPSRSLRSSNQSLDTGCFKVHPKDLSWTDRAFAVAGPRLQNALPNHMRQPGVSLATFKKSHKTYLFKKAFL